MIRALWLFLALAVTPPAIAADLGVGPSQEAKFRAEARAIAGREVKPDREIVLPGQVEQTLIDTDPDLKAAWRSDPEATLDLIRRIIEAADQ